METRTRSDSSNPQPLQRWLTDFIVKHGGVSGTVHLLGPANELELACSHNIPDKVIAVVGRIPRGKGMAGLAWERNAPVSTCNLKTDATGDVRPGAKAVDASAAVALPVYDLDGSFLAVVGIAYAEQRDLSDQELQDLTRDAGTLPR